MSTTTVLTATDIPTDALAAWLAEQTWSSFAQSLAAFFADRGYLTPDQERGARSMYAKIQARKATPAPTTVPVEVHSGHYALVVDGVVKFYKVFVGHTRTFVDAQASDGYFPIQNRSTRDTVLAGIAADPIAAMKLYGVELGKCGHCGRKLTSEWRKVGIGPVCNGKMGW